MIWVNKHMGVLFLLLMGVWVSLVNGATLTESELTPQIKQFVVKKVLDEYPFSTAEDVKVTLKTPKGMTPPEGATSWLLDVDPEVHFVGTTQVSLVYFDDQKSELKRVPILFQVKAWGHFIKATRIIYQNETLTTQNCEDIYAQVSAKPFHAVSLMSQVLGKEAITTIGRETILTDTMIRSIPSIRKGDKIQIILKKNNIELKFKGEALENGIEKKKIHVRSGLPDRKVLEGDVIDSKNVQVISLY